MSVANLGSARIGADAGTNHKFLRLYDPDSFLACLRLVQTSPVAEIGDPEMTRYCSSLEGRVLAAISTLDVKAGEARIAANPVAMDGAFVLALEIDLFNAAANVERHGAKLLGEPQKF